MMSHPLSDLVKPIVLYPKEAELSPPSHQPRRVSPVTQASHFETMPASLGMDDAVLGKSRQDYIK